jgi:hypothetical protein
MAAAAHMHSRDCTFLNFWRNGATGWGVIMASNSNFWSLEGNVFDGIKSPIIFGSVTDVSITGNTMTK